jgi:hypothetical protein
VDIKVELDGDEIVVMRPGTDFLLAYRKAPDRPGLVQTQTWVAPTTTSPEISKFRALAFQAAIAKARKLGWVV